jgi:hypothetical protein
MKEYDHMKLIKNLEEELLEIETKYSLKKSNEVENDLHN